MSTRSPITGQQLLDKLECDPDFRARRAAQDAHQKARRLAIKQEEEPLIQEIARAGYQLEFISDLANCKAKYKELIPILLKHLSFDYSLKLKEFIARALARPWARETAWEFVLEAYRNEGNESSTSYKSGLAVALSSMARADDLAIITELARDFRNGPTRLFFVRNLSRSRRPDSYGSLLELASDPDLREEIAHVLRRKKRAKGRRN